MSDPAPRSVVINTGDSAPAPGTISLFKENPTSIQKNISAVVTQDDMVAITVSKVEDQIRTRLATFKKEAASIAKDLRAIEKAIESFLDTWCVQSTSNLDTSTLIRALNNFGIGELDTNYSTAHYDKRTGTLSATISIVPIQSSSHFGGITKKIKAPAPDRFVEMIDDKSHIEEQLRTANLNVAKAENALYSTDTIERKAKAALAKETISQTEDGASIVRALESYDGNVDSLIDSLA